MPTKKEYRAALETPTQRGHREEIVARVGGGAYLGYYLTEGETPENMWVHVVGQKGVVVQCFYLSESEPLGRWAEDYTLATPLYY